MMGSEEDDIAFQESKKVPTYLAMALQQMTYIFGVSSYFITHVYNKPIEGLLTSS